MHFDYKNSWIKWKMKKLWHSKWSDLHHFYKICSNERFPIDGCTISIIRYSDWWVTSRNLKCTVFMRESIPTNFLHTSRVYASVTINLAVYFRHPTTANPLYVLCSHRIEWSLFRTIKYPYYVYTSIVYILHCAEQHQNLLTHIQPASKIHNSDRAYVYTNVQ